MVNSIKIGNIKISEPYVYVGLIILHRKKFKYGIHLFTWNFLFCKKIETFISCVETTRKIKKFESPVVMFDLVVQTVSDILNVPDEISLGFYIHRFARCQ